METGWNLKTGTLGYTVFCMEFIRCYAIDGDGLEPVVKIELKPRVHIPRNAKVLGEAIEQNCVVHSIKSCAEVEKCE